MVKSKVSRWESVGAEEIVRHMTKINRDPDQWHGFRKEDSIFGQLARSLWGSTANARDRLRLNTMYYRNENDLQKIFRRKVHRRIKTLRTPVACSTPRINAQQYCSCGRNYQESDDGLFEQDPSMVECTQCSRWYHCVCVQKKTEDVARDPKFRCPRCKNRSKLRFPVICLPKLPVDYVEYQVMSEVSEVLTPSSLAGDRYQPSEGVATLITSGLQSTMVSSEDTFDEIIHKPMDQVDDDIEILSQSETDEESNLIKEMPLRETNMGKLSTKRKCAKLPTRNCKLPIERNKHGPGFTFEIPSEEWTSRLYRRQHDWGIRNYGSLMRKYLKKYARTCPLIAKYHKVRMGFWIYFSGKMVCKDSKCLQWVLHALDGPKEGGSITIHVSWARPYRRHDPEFSYTFPLKGLEREQVQHDMITTNSKAGAFATKYYCNGSTKEAYEGNMTSFRKRNIFRQALYEGKLKQDFALDPIDDLRYQFAAEKAKNDPFIQSFSISPLRVVTFTNKCLKLLGLMKKVPHHHMVAHFDATGTLISPLRSDVVDSGTIYVYSLALKHPTKGIPPFSLAEFIMNSHSIGDIAGALTVFLKKASSFLNKPKSPIFQRFELDFSEAMIGAVLQCTLNTNINDYLDRCWEILISGRKAHNFNIHVCRTHNIRNQRKKILQYYASSPLYDRDFKTLGGLLHQWFYSDSIGGLAYRTEKLLMLLTAPFLEDVQHIIASCNDRTPKSYVAEHEDEWRYHDISRRPDRTTHRSTAFGSFVHSMNERISDTAWLSSGQPNPFNNADYKQYLLVYFFPYSPLFTHIMFAITNDEKVDDHQTAVEQVFRSIKREEQGTVGTQKIGQYIRKSQTSLKGRRKEFKARFIEHYRVNVRNAERNKVHIDQDDQTDHEESPVESWKKRGRPLGIRRLPKVNLLPDVVIVPWGTASATDTATKLTNTCPIDKVLTLLTMIHTNFACFREFLLDCQQHENELVDNITAVIQFVVAKNFNAAKVRWITSVVNQHLSSLPISDGAFNVVGCENDIGLLVWEPLLSPFAITRRCPIHGTVDETGHNISALGLVGRTPAEVLQQLKPLPKLEKIPCKHYSKGVCREPTERVIIQRSSLPPLIIITPHATAEMSQTLSLVPHYADIMGTVYNLLAITVRRDDEDSLPHFYAIILENGEWYVADGMIPQIEKYRQGRHEFTCIVSCWYYKQQ